MSSPQLTPPSRTNRRAWHLENRASEWGKTWSSSSHIWASHWCARSGGPTPCVLEPALLDHVSAQRQGEQSGVAASIINGRIVLQQLLNLQRRGERKGGRCTETGSASAVRHAAVTWFCASSTPPSPSRQTRRGAGGTLLRFLARKTCHMACACLLAAAIVACPPPPSRASLPEAIANPPHTLPLTDRQQLRRLRTRRTM